MAVLRVALESTLGSTTEAGTPPGALQDDQEVREVAPPTPGAHVTRVQGSGAPVHVDASARGPSDHHHSCRQCQEGGRQRRPSDQPSLRSKHTRAAGGGAWNEILARFAVSGASERVSKFVQNLLLWLKICASKFARKKFKILS